MKALLYTGIILCIMVPGICWSTEVSGTISTTTWTSANSPYHVTGIITIPSGNILTIDAGVDVIFDTDAQFVVEGALHTRGTENDSVRFIKGLAYYWYGLRISGGDSSSLSYTRISNAMSATYTYPDNCGGGIYIHGTATRACLNHCTISNNLVYTSGGGIFNDSSSVALHNCVFTNNMASGPGGGLYNSPSARSLLTACEITDNSATYGAGVYTRDGVVTLVSSNIINNNASHSGGGMYTTDTSPEARNTIEITECEIRDNTAGGEGGGIFSRSSSIEITDSHICSNTAEERGGGIISTLHAALTLDNTVIDGNTAVQNAGGGINNGTYMTDSSRAILTNCTINGNSADGSSGGGIHNGAIAELTRCSLTGNTSGNGGALYNAEDGIFSLTKCVITGNSVTDGHGGALYNFIASATLNDCSIHGNTAAGAETGGDGGGIFNYRSTLNLTNCTMYGNSAPDGEGGALCDFHTTTTTLTHCTISGNSATEGGGGVHSCFYSNGITLTDCILWGNTPTDEISDGTISVTYSCFEGGFSGTGNIDSDPLFADTTNHDYQLSAGSPCIDTGDPAHENDPDGTRADMGVIFPDYGSPPVWETCADRCVDTGNQLKFTVSAIDPENNGLTYSAVQLPEGAEFNPLTRLFVWVPTVNQVGIDTTIFYVTDGRSMVMDTVLVTVNLSPVGIRLPEVFALSQNAPNPFNPVTTIEFSLPEAGVTNLVIYDVTGRQIRTLVSGTVEAGMHSVVWDGRDAVGHPAASGVYIYRLTTSEGNLVRRMTLIR